MNTAIPTARIRTDVIIPMTFADGFSTVGRVFTFEGLIDNREHIAIGLGNRAESPASRESNLNVPLVRPHSECLTGDVFGSQRCDCGPQLREACERISAVGGYLLYLRQEGRGIGLYAKMEAYKLQDSGLDTYDANIALGYGADIRDYTVAAQMLQALGEPRIEILSNNPEKLAQLRNLGVEVIRQVQTKTHLTKANEQYLNAKVTRGSHSLSLPHR